MSKIDALVARYCPHGVPYTPLGEVCDLKRGETISKKAITSGEVPVISGGQKPSYYHNKSNRLPPIITIAGSGVYSGFVNFWTIPIFVNDSFSIQPTTDILNIRYLYHWLTNNQNTLYQLQRGVAIPHVYPNDVAQLKIPLPPLEVQRKIVEILDQFHTLTTSLTEGIPAEIEARRKQYTYYRNKLLTFKEQVPNLTK